MSPDENMIICISGRGDKDVHTLFEQQKEEDSHDQ